MPPKVKTTRQDIIDTSISLIRKYGFDFLNARSLAKALNCSTQPIFSNFSSMEELEGEIIVSAYNLYLNYIKVEVESQKYPKYKSFGMAYVRFAKEEKELFKLLFMRDRNGEEFVPTPDFTESINMISNSIGISKKQAELMHLEMWTCVHGIGVMLATSFYDLDFELVSTILSDVYQGVRQKHVNKES